MQSIATILQKTVEVGMLQSEQEKMSYSVGLKAGADLWKQFQDLNIDSFKKGFLDALENRKSLLSDQELVQSLEQFQKQTEVKQRILIQQLAEKNQTEGEKFLQENKKKEGIYTFTSGLQYKILKRGSGLTPSMHNTVTVHYKGSLLNETVFDSTYDRNKPVEIAVNKTIPGWSEALKKMKEGDKWRLFIPSYLAYGESGFGRQIAPNATLIFELELLKVA